MRVPKGVRLCSRGPGRASSRGGGTLTLRADGPLPAFLADAREGLAVDHTGAPVMAGVGQAATVSGCETRADKTTLPEDPEASWRANSQMRENTPPGADQQTRSGGRAHGKSHVGQKVTYVTSRSFPATRTHALKSIPFVIAGATVVARGLVTLTVTWRKNRCESCESQGPAPTEDRKGCRDRLQGRRLLTRVAGLSFPPIFTVTVEVIDQVATGAPVVAGVLAAVVNI